MTDNHQSPRQASDIQKAEILDSELRHMREAGAPNFSPQDIAKLEKEAAAVFTRASATLHQASQEALKNPADAQQVFEAPQVKEAIDIARMTAPHVSETSLAQHAATQNPREASEVLDVSSNTLSAYEFADHAGNLAGARFGRQYQEAAEVSASLREQMKQQFGVREPANPLDIKRAGKEAQDFATYMLEPAQAREALLGAAVSKTELEREAAHSLQGAAFSAAEYPADYQQSVTEVAKEWHATIGRHTPPKTYTRQELEALAAKCDPRDFAPREYDPNDLAALEHNHDAHEAHGMSADELHEQHGRKAIADTLAAAERNQNQQAPDRTQEATKARGFSR